MPRTATVKARTTNAIKRNPKLLCALCSETMIHPNDEKNYKIQIYNHLRATIDHIQPKSSGTNNDPSNLQLVHAYCNSIRGMSDITENLKMKISYHVASKFRNTLNDLQIKKKQPW